MEGYELRELQPQLPPIQEGLPGHPEPPQPPQFFFGVGSQPPQRALYFRSDDRFVAQLQRDRIAINERRTATDPADPSSENVWPKLDEFSKTVAAALVHEGEAYGPRKPTFVELTYVNTIVPAEGVWTDHAELHKILHIVSAKAGDTPYAHPERAGVQFSFPLPTADAFRGRLHVAVNPGFSAEGSPVFHLNLVSRRLVDESESLMSVFDACHYDAVLAFAAITTSRMHKIWGRIR